MATNRPCEVLRRFIATVLQPNNAPLLGPCIGFLRMHLSMSFVNGDKKDRGSVPRSCERLRETIRSALGYLHDGFGGA